MSQDTTKAVVWRPTTTLPHPLRDKLETLAQRIDALLTKTTTILAAHKRVTGKCMLDVFGGSGFLAKATNHLGLRGYVLDTGVGPRYDVTKPLVLTSIRQDVSAGTCVAGMISPPRQRTPSSPKIVSARAAISNLLHRARLPWYRRSKHCSLASHGLALAGHCILF